MSTQAPAPAGEDRPTEFPVIDTDVHEMLPSVLELVPYLPEHFQRYITHGGWRTPNYSPYAYATDHGFARTDAFPKDGPPGSSYELMREQLLDRYGMHHAILTGLFFPSDMRVQHEFMSAVAAAYNDYLAEHWLARDPRLLGSLCVNMNEPQAAAREVDRMGDHPQIVQVMFSSSEIGFGEPQFHPIYEAAARHGLRIGVHTSGLTQTSVRHHRYQLEWRTVSHPEQYMSQIASLVAAGVFEKFPDLKFAMLEGGWTWLPSFLWRFDLHYREFRVEVPWLKRLPSEYIRDHFVFSTQPLEDIGRNEIMTILDLIGSDRVLVFATDYPHFDFDSPTQTLTDLPADLRRRILHDNAAEFYGL